MFTEAQLNSKNKSQLVELAAELQLRLAAYQNGPLSSSQIERALLDLARQAQTVKDNAVKREQEHTKALQELQNQFDLAKRKMELDFVSEEGTEALNLEKLFADLEKRAQVAADDLSFGLKKAEIENQEKIDALNARLDQIVAENEEKIAASNARVEETRVKSGEEIAKLALEHSRKMEQTRYDNGIALRDENLKAAEKIATIYEKVLVDAKEYTTLKDFKATEAKDVQAQIEAAVKAAKSEVFASEGSKISSLKAEKDAKIALLEKDVDYLKGTISTQEALIAELKEQIKAFPGQLAKAVEAAKSEVTVNQDNKK
jgi:hypothetical protein